jgi:hypothetical protein
MDRYQHLKSKLYQYVFLQEHICARPQFESKAQQKKSRKFRKRKIRPKWQICPKMAEFPILWIISEMAEFPNLKKLSNQCFTTSVITEENSNKSTYAMTD